MTKLQTFLTIACIFAVSFGVHAQTTLAAGKITDENDVPLANAVISIKSTGEKTVTDNNGNFELKTSRSFPITIEISYDGYRRKNVEIHDENPVSITLSKPNSDNVLDEVVITALGISREKKSLGYTTQELKSRDIEGTTETNLVNALSGKLAGVRTTNSQGDMGSSRIVIRGETSISGNNQPLFVVDGVPVDNSQLYPSSTAAGRDQSRDFRNTIADINPEDIASINVLKGPTAAALYGSRAAHGAVLITTKSGKGQKGLGISVNTGVTFSTIATLPKFQNVFGQGSNGEFSYVDGKGGGINDGDDESWGPRLDAGLLIPQFHSNGVAVPFVAHPNNVKDFFETGITQDYGFAIANSDDKYNFRLSASRQDQKGTVPNTEIKKTNFTLSTDYQLTDRIKIGGNANYIVTDAPNIPGGASPTGSNYRASSVMLQFLWFGRQVDMAELKKDYAQNWNNSYYSNPYWRAYYNTVEQKRDRLIGDIHFSVNILEGLDFKFRSGTDWYNDRRKYKIKTGTNGTPDGSYAEDAYTVRESNTDAILTFTRNLDENFSIDALVGFNVRNNTYSNNWQKATKLAAPDLFTLNNSKDPLQSDNYFSRFRVYSDFASVLIGYKNYAFLNLTGRNDFSSTLPKPHAFFYPSATASLIVSEWLGIKSNGLSLLKLRGGWAEVGNDAQAYQLHNTYNILTAFNGNPIQTSSKSNNNSNIKPEKTQSTELGVELAFLNNRIHFDVALYNTNSINQILNVQTSAPSGYLYQLINAGKINNKGIELQLNATPVISGGFRWDINLNYASNRSKVIKLDDAGLLKNYVIGTAGVSVVAAVGERYGSLYGTAYLRDDKGNIIVDSNGRPERDPNNHVLGHFAPDWTGGVSNTFSYKGIELSFLIDASIGGNIWSGTAQTSYYTGVDIGTLPGRDTAHGGITFTDANGKVRDDGMIFKGVTENGNPNTTIIDAESYYKASYSINEEYIRDASYVKLREIKLGYTFNKNWIKKIIGLEGATFSVTARNIAFLYKDKNLNVDPEAAITTGNVQGIEVYALPTTRSIGFNLNLKF